MNQCVYEWYGCCWTIYDKVVIIRNFAIRIKHLDDMANITSYMISIALDRKTTGNEFWFTIRLGQSSRRFVHQPSPGNFSTFLFLLFPIPLPCVAHVRIVSPLLLLMCVLSPLCCSGITGVDNRCVFMVKYIERIRIDYNYFFCLRLLCVFLCVTH